MPRKEAKERLSFPQCAMITQSGKQCRYKIENKETIFCLHHKGLHYTKKDIEEIRKNPKKCNSCRNKVLQSESHCYQCNTSRDKLNASRRDKYAKKKGVCQKDNCNNVGHKFIEYLGTNYFLCKECYDEAREVIEEQQEKICIVPNCSYKVKKKYNYRVCGNHKTFLDFIDDDILKNAKYCKKCKKTTMFINGKCYNHTQGLKKETKFKNIEDEIDDDNISESDSDSNSEFDFKVKPKEKKYIDVSAIEKKLIEEERLKKEAKKIVKHQCIGIMADFKQCDSMLSEGIICGKHQKQYEKYGDRIKELSEFCKGCCSIKLKEEMKGKRCKGCVNKWKEKHKDKCKRQCEFGIGNCKVGATKEFDDKWYCGNHYNSLLGRKKILKTKNICKSGFNCMQEINKDEDYCKYCKSHLDDFAEDSEIDNDLLVCSKLKCQQYFKPFLNRNNVISKQCMKCNIQGRMNEQSRKDKKRQNRIDPVVDEDEINRRKLRKKHKKETK